MTKMKRTLKAVVSILLCLMMVTGLFPESALEALRVWGAPAETSGDWTDYAADSVTPDEGDVYRISSAEELAWVANAVNGVYDDDEDAPDLSSATILLTRDIDLSEHYWIPIGHRWNCPFSASFNGNGKTISGLRVGSQTTPYGAEIDAGLFGFLTGSVINLKITDAAVYSQHPEGTYQMFAGILAGRMSGGSIKNCEVNGAVSIKGVTSKQSGGAGAITGSMQSNALIDSCRVQASVSLTDPDGYCYLGGVAGIAGSATAAKIENCVSYTEFSVPIDYVPANVGCGALYGTSKNCTARNCIARCDLGSAGSFSGAHSTIRNVCWIEGDTGTYFGKPLEDAVPMDAADMKSESFISTLNAAKDFLDVNNTLLSWSIDEDVNDGFPNLADAGITGTFATYYQVTFVSDGLVYRTETVEEGSKAAKPMNPPAAQDDVTFLYWYASDESEEYDFNTPVTANLTLTAKWKSQGTPEPGNESFTVRFDCRGGSYIYPQTVKAGGNAAEPAQPVKKGFAFGGWYTNSACTLAFDFNTAITADTVLYAKWTEATDAAVSGRITDKNTGNGIRNATVTLSGGRNAATDEFGYYRITGVEPGTYTITVSAYGYHDAEQTGFVVGNVSKGYDAALTPKNGAAGAQTVNIYATVSCVYSGIMLDGVQIRAVGEGDLGTYTQTTENGGLANFTGLPAGAYRFYINHSGRPGWESYTSDLRNLSGDYQLNCALKPNYQSLKINVLGSFDPVSNQSNAPLKGKTVTLTGVDPADEENVLITINAYTGEDGSVTVEKLVPVTWKITSSDFAYEEQEEVVYSDGSGKLSQKEVTLTLPFVDSSLSVNFDSVYDDADLFKKTDDNPNPLDVTLTGVAGTMTEGIIRSAVPDAAGKVVFSGLFPGTYNLRAMGKSKRYVSITAGDGQEIFTDSATEDFSRFGKKHFDVELNGTTTANVALGMRASATVTLDPSPASFSGTLFKTDMDENGEIKTVPCANTTITIKPSAYYPQSGDAANGYEITTDANGHYAISLAPGLYGVEAENRYAGYFGGRLTYHEGNSDGYVGAWGWPCTDRWTGTRASAVSWMTGDDSLSYGDIGGMSISSGSVVADLEMMEKKINYSACSPGNPVIYDNLTSYNLMIGRETAEEATEDDRTTAWNNYDYYENTYEYMNYHPDTKGASIKLTGDKQETVAMTGKTFPYVFHELSPGDYGLDYQISDAFSELESSVSWGGQITFFDFPAPGKLPNSFPEDYAENGNPWPLSTKNSGLRIDAKEGRRTFRNIHDSIQFKFYNLNLYESTTNPAQPEKPLDAESVYDTFNGVPSDQWDTYQSNYADRDLHWRWDTAEEGELSEAVYDNSTTPTVAEYFKLEYPVSPSVMGYGSKVYKPTACDFPADPVYPEQGENESWEDYLTRCEPISRKYQEDKDKFKEALEEAKEQYRTDYAAWYQNAYIGAGFPKAGKLYITPEEAGFWDAYYDSASYSILEKYLVGYSTSRIPDKLFYYKYTTTNRNKPIPDGTVTLYFCAPKGKGHVFLNNLQNIENREKYEDLYNSDLWFSVTLDNNNTGAIYCDVNFLYPDQCSANVSILTKEQVKHLLNPRTIVVKAVESGNENHILDDVDVTITYAGRNFSSMSPTAEQTCFGTVTEVEVAADEYEWEYKNAYSVLSTYDDGTKTETFFVPLTRIPYSKEFVIRDDAGNPVSNASICLTGKSVGQPVYIFTQDNGKAYAINNLTYQDYEAHVSCPGYSSIHLQLSAEQIRAEDEVSDRLTRDAQPDFVENSVSINRKGAFLPGVCFTGSSNSIDFLIDLAITEAKDKPVYYTVDAQIKTALADSLQEVFLVDKKVFENPDFSDAPEVLATPAMGEDTYNPSEALQWLKELAEGSHGNVYYRALSRGEAFVPVSVDQNGRSLYEISATLPLWELPPDGFEPCLIAVTANYAVQIYDFDYSGESEDDRLVGIRLSGDSAAMLNNITLLANAKALGGPAVEKLEELTQPTGSLIPLPNFESGIELDDDGFLTYTYTIEMQLLQGRKSVSDAEKSYMALLPSTLGVAASGGWNLELNGHDRELSTSFDIAVSKTNADALDYLPSAFSKLPVKVEFDEDNPPTGKFTLASTDTKDKNNHNTKEEYSFGANGQVHVVAQVSAFSSVAAILPVGPILASLEKSGALDIGAQVKVAVGADGTYTYTILNGEETEHDLTFTVGAGAGLGIYAKAFGGAVGAEANVKLSGDNPKLEDMVTVSASIGKDGFHMNRVDGKVVADAHIELKTWFINGEKDFTFAEIPFSYQFGTQTHFSLTQIGVVDHMRSRDDFEPSTFNGQPETVVSNLLPIGGYGADEDGSGAFVYTDMSAKGGNVRLMLAEHAGGTRWDQPVSVTATDGLIPALDVISMSGGYYLIVWSEISKTDMMMTCPPSMIKYSVGKISEGKWNGSIKTLRTLSSEVASKLLLVSDSSGIGLVALKTAEGALAERLSISGSRFSGSAWSAPTDLAKEQKTYDIAACMRSGALFVSYVTDDRKLHVLKWKDTVTGSVFDAAGSETAMAADDINAYLVNESAEGLVLRRLSGNVWSAGDMIDQNSSSGNPSLTVSGNRIHVTFTDQNDQSLNLIECAADGGVLERSELKKASGSDRFTDSTMICSDDKELILTVADGTSDRLNVYSPDISDKEPAIIITDPKAVAGLRYNGSAQELVRPGTAEGGTIRYAVTKSGDPEPEETDFSASVPSAYDAGSYRVYYKLVADADHMAAVHSSLPYIDVRITRAVLSDDMLSLITPAFYVNGDPEESGYEQTTEGILVKAGLHLLKEGTDYDIAPGSVLHADDFGTYTITVTGKGNYSGSAKTVWKVIRVEQSGEEGDMFAHSVIDPLLYTGAPLTPQPVITWNGIELVKDQDYTLTYKNNINAATKEDGAKAPAVTIKGKGKYKDTITIPFTIEKRHLDDGSENALFADDLTVSIGNKQWTGKTLLSKPTIRFVDGNGKTITLKEKKDYTLTFTDSAGSAEPKAAGTVTIYVEGSGNFTGTAKVSYEIIAKSADAELKNAVIAPIPDQVFTGTAFTQDEIEDLVTVWPSKNAEKDGEDPVDSESYTVSYHPADTLKTGKVTITVQGTAGHGELWKTVTFKMLPKPVAVTEDGNETPQVEIALDEKEDPVYTGKPLKPAIVVVDPALDPEVYPDRIVPASDYTVKYKNNTNAAEENAVKEVRGKEVSIAPTVILTFKGNYKGTLSMPFTIAPLPVDEAELSVTQADIKDNNKPITEETLKPVVKLGKTTLKKDKDYEILFGRDESREMQEAVISLLGNYAGEKSYAFRIYNADSVLNLANPEAFSAVADETVLTYNGRKIVPGVSVTDLITGRKLVNGRDYTLSASKNTNASPAGTKNSPVWKVTGKGAYKGSISDTFAIAPKELSEETCIITVSDAKYNNGKEVKPKVTVTDRATGKALKAGKDYTVVYANNKDKREADAEGAPAVLITGNGNYTTAGCGLENETLKKTFRIYETDISSVKVEGIGAAVYTGSQIKPETFTVSAGSGRNKTVLTKGTDYTVEYGENVNAGTGTVIIRGMGTYGNTKVVKFTILPKILKWLIIP